MSDERFQAVHIVGGGLAGSEAAWQVAALGVTVVLHEMRPLRTTAAHNTAALAELVCSNSFRSDDREHNAVGLLHEEMRRLGSLIMRTDDLHQVPAGGALAVDRERRWASLSDAERLAIEAADTAANPKPPGMHSALWKVMRRAARLDRMDVQSLHGEPPK